MTGYVHPSYAESLAEFGMPRELPRCGGWILERQIPGSSYRDGMGCYPLFACRDWSKLHDDLAEIGNNMVSLSIVTDPFGDYDLDLLRECFDVIVPFKEHYVANLAQPREVIVSKSHRSTVRRAMRKVEVSWCPDPMLHLGEWVDLFSNLVGRHNIRGIRAFSQKAFVKQLSTPGMAMFKAESQGAIIGLDLWYVQGEVAYGHLVALNPLGYQLRASYALKWFLLQYFADKVHWLDLGAAAGTAAESMDGLSQFKRGWSTGTRTAYFCGRIFNRERYTEIVKEKTIGATDYFPAYRKGEFK